MWAIRVAAVIICGWTAAAMIRTAIRPGQRLSETRTRILALGNRRHLTRQILVTSPLTLSSAILAWNGTIPIVWTAFSAASGLYIVGSSIALANELFGSSVDEALRHRLANDPVSTDHEERADGTRVGRATVLQLLLIAGALIELYRSFRQ